MEFRLRQVDNVSAYHYFVRIKMKGLTIIADWVVHSYFGKYFDLPKKSLKSFRRHKPISVIVSRFGRRPLIPLCTFDAYVILTSNFASESDPLVPCIEYFLYCRF